MEWSGKGYVLVHAGKCAQGQVWRGVAVAAEVAAGRQAVGTASYCMQTRGTNMSGYVYNAATWSVGDKIANKTDRRAIDQSERWTRIGFARSCSCGRGCNAQSG